MDVIESSFYIRKMDKQSLSKETGARFQDSFGSWIALAKFMRKAEFMQLQALNRKAYRISVPRVQARWPLYSQIMGFISSDKHLHIYMLSKNSHSLVRVVELDTEFGSCMFKGGKLYTLCPSDVHVTYVNHQSYSNLIDYGDELWYSQESDSQCPHSYKNCSDEKELCEYSGFLKG